MKKKWREFIQDVTICLFLLVLWIAALLYVTDEDYTARQYYQDAETMEYCPVELEE